MATQSGSTFAGKGTESDSPDGDLFSMLTSGANAVAAGAQAVKRALLDPSNPNAVSQQGRGQHDERYPAAPAAAGAVAPVADEGVVERLNDAGRGQKGADGPYGDASRHVGV